MRYAAVLLVLLLPATARAGHIDVMPFAGYAWGGTEKFDFDLGGSGLDLRFSGDIHVNAAPEYGVSIAAYGRLFGAEVVYHVQPTEAVVRYRLQAAGVDTSGSETFDAATHYLLLQIIRQYPLGHWYPYVEAGVGATAAVAEGESSWDFGCSFGGGIRRQFENGGSLRLTVRMLAPLEITDDGFSFGAANSGVLVGGRNKFFQGDVHLGYSYPIWGRRPGGAAKRADR